jgi:hypothetical protein
MATVSWIINLPFSSRTDFLAPSSAVGRMSGFLMSHPKTDWQEPTPSGHSVPHPDTLDFMEKMY